MINIRRATILDIYNIYNCNKECLPIYYSMDQLMFFILFSGEIFVAEESDDLYGYIIGEYQGEYFHIMSFGVYKKHRRKGIGTKLMDKAEEYVKNRCKFLSLNVHAENDTGIKFYEKNGFKFSKILSNYYGGNLKNVATQDAFRFEKKVN